MGFLDPEKYLDAVCRMLAEGSRDVPVPIRGNQMLPFLKGADFACLVPLPRKIRPGDLILYRRCRGHYVLRRVYRVCRKGGYLMLGDNQVIPEPVSDHQLRAKVSSVRCGGRVLTPKNIRWWFFAHPRRWLVTLRRLSRRIPKEAE